MRSENFYWDISANADMIDVNKEIEAGADVAALKGHWHLKLNNLDIYEVIKTNTTINIQTIDKAVVIVKQKPAMYIQFYLSLSDRI